MRIAVFNTSDIEGGAARAAYRLCEGLRLSGVDLSMHVQVKSGEKSWAIAPRGKLRKGFGLIRPALDSLPLKLYRNRAKTPWSLSWLPNPMLDLKQIEAAADLIHLNWVAGGFLSISSLKKFHKPIVWTFHDMWAMTGGCHVNGACDRFVNSCGQCPQLCSQKTNDLSRWVFERKNKTWADIPITVVAPSRWLAAEARRSSLFGKNRIEIIPNGLDLSLYKPIEKHLARSMLGLPTKGSLILFGAMNATSDKNKGFGYLESALKTLSLEARLDDIRLVVFGASEPEHPPVFGFPTHYLGRLYDDLTLAVVYSAADVTVVPSMQEAFGQTASESLACGTPVVAFGTTGLLDIIDHQQNGYLAQPFKPESLAKGISWVLEDKETWKRLSANARHKCEENFEISIVTKQYIKIYESILENRIC